MSVAGLVVIAIEIALILPRAARLTKQLQELNLLLANNFRLAHDELRILHQAIDETAGLLRPYRRVQRWLTHPMAMALFASFRRRTARRRSASMVR